MLLCRGVARGGDHRACPGDPRRDDSPCFGNKTSRLGVDARHKAGQDEIQRFAGRADISTSFLFPKFHFGKRRADSPERLGHVDPPQSLCSVQCVLT